MVDGFSELTPTGPDPQACLRLGLMAFKEQRAVGPPEGAKVLYDIPRANGVGSILACGHCALECAVLRPTDWTSVVAVSEHGGQRSGVDCPAVSV